MVAVRVIHVRVGQGADFLAAEVHHQIDRFRLVLAALGGDHRQSLAELDALALRQRGVGENRQLLAGFIDQGQLAAGLHHKRAVLGEGKRLGVLHGDHQDAVRIHITEAASLEPGDHPPVFPHADPFARQGHRRHTIVKFTGGGIVRLQQLGPVGAVEAVQAVLPYRIDAVLLAVGGHIVDPQRDDLLHRGEGGDRQRQAQQPR